MKNILLINAHQVTEMSAGKYNATLMKKSRVVLEESYNIKTTILEDGYNAEEEVEKMLWADYVIFQFPVYWMDVPFLFKQYLDQGLSSSLLKALSGAFQVVENIYFFSLAKPPEP